MKVETISINSLIEYSGIGVSIFIVLLTNPEVWQDARQRSLSRWFIISPIFLLLGLILLLLTHVFPSYRIFEIGFFSILIGTIMVAISYAWFLLITFALRPTARSLFWVAHLLDVLHLSLHKAAERMERFRR
ncbi:hypothetical protein HYR99_35170 [Candidatus Poribacteria bacterium]|nr:hypothetical protein [Candidatus Poribacteria bacterium]